LGSGFCLVIGTSKGPSSSSSSGSATKSNKWFNLAWEKYWMKLDIQKTV
jgi:hypothetical protein